MNAAGGRKMRIVKFNLPDTAVWNPWFGIGRFIQDLDDDEYSKMLCVESGRYGKPIVLKPGETYEAKAILQVKTNAWCLQLLHMKFYIFIF